MRYVAIISLLVTIAINSQAAMDEWFCTTQSSKITGQVISACGIGRGKDEETARFNAFNAAKREYASVCDVSTFCKGRAVSVEPKRTTCDKDESGWKCYRLVDFAIKDKSSSSVALNSDPKLQAIFDAHRLACELDAKFGNPWTLNDGSILDCSKL